MPYDIPIIDGNPVRSSIRELAPINRPVQFAQMGPVSDLSQPSRVALSTIVGGVVVTRPPFYYPHPPQFDPVPAGSAGVIGPQGIQNIGILLATNGTLIVELTFPSVEDPQLAPIIVVEADGIRSTAVFNSYGTASRLVYDVDPALSEPDPYWVVETFPGFFTVSVIRFAVGLAGTLGPEIA